MSGTARGRRPRPLTFMLLFGALAAALVAFPRSAGAGPGSGIAPQSVGALDCNGYSSIQQTIKPAAVCTDVRGLGGVDNSNTWGGRFYDRGHYIGHDEPDLTFLSSRPGSGNDVTWMETLPIDPASLPTVATPGSDITHWFELSIAPWFSMALCNSQSYPLMPCVPNSDKNAPACPNGFNCPPNSYPGGGSSFLEMQFYPPGNAPFVDSISCNNSQWCASLHINDLECSQGFASCNTACEEPTNFAFVQKDGVPTGPPNPQQATNASYTPNSETLLMNPGDKLKIHIWDAPAPGGGSALEVSIDDLTTGQSGTMQASAANGFAQTDPITCNGAYFNYEPEYSTASTGNIVPWAALQTDISTEYEIGHFTPCTSVSDFLFNGAGGAGDPVFGTCSGPYETTSDSSNGEGQFGDGPCWPLGDTHGTLNSDPNLVAGCLNFFSGGDHDYDGTSYWPDWPTGTSPTTTTPGSFVQSAPLTAGHHYGSAFFQTDAALSEPSCTSSSLSGCTIPPPGPGNFYPYWSETTLKGSCTIEFGNLSSGPGVNDFGADAQYGPNRFPQLGYPEFEGKPSGNAAC